MECERAGERLLDLLYGEIDGCDRVAVEDHLGTCTDCLAAFRSMSGTRAAFASQRNKDDGDASKPPVETHRAILTAARVFVPTAGRLRPAMPVAPAALASRFAGAPVACAAASLVVGIGLGAAYLRPGQEGDEESGPQQARAGVGPIFVPVDGGLGDIIDVANEPGQSRPHSPNRSPRHRVGEQSSPFPSLFDHVTTSQLFQVDLGHREFGHGHYDAAIAQYCRALRLDPGSPNAPEILHAIARCYCRKGNHELAGAYLNGLLRYFPLYPNRADALRDGARCLLAANDPDGARQFLERWSSEYPEAQAIADEFESELVSEPGIDFPGQRGRQEGRLSPSEHEAICSATRN